ncbi:unnamed protein product [Leuciscus chuanchicus]
MKAAGFLQYSTQAVPGTLECGCGNEDQLSHERPHTGQIQHLPTASATQINITNHTDKQTRFNLDVSGMAYERCPGQATHANTSVPVMSQYLTAFAWDSSSCFHQLCLHYCESPSSRITNTLHASANYHSDCLSVNHSQESEKSRTGNSSVFSVWATLMMKQRLSMYHALNVRGNIGVATIILLQKSPQLLPVLVLLPPGRDVICSAKAPPTPPVLLSADL